MGFPYIVVDKPGSIQVNYQQMFHYLQRCRACSHTKLTKVFSLGLQPLANSFKTRDEEQTGFAPLEVMLCPVCQLAQLSVVVRPEVMFQNYPYITSRSQTMQDHFENLWQAIKLECFPESVVEVGSNDGYFLKFCRDKGSQYVCGIDPASNLAPEAGAQGVASLVGCFSFETARMARLVVPYPSVVVARHVMAHIDDWKQFVLDLDSLCAKDTLIVIEVPYVMDTLERVELDQIYFEHLSYVSIKALAALLNDTPFQVHKAMRFPVHGGSIAIFIRRRNGRAVAHESVERFIKAENITEQMWRDFSVAAHKKIEKLKSFIGWEVYPEGRKVCGFGASAKSTVWISACGFTKKEISFVVDNTPQKQGKLSPGTDIPILPESALTNKSADIAICFAWNFWKNIIEKNKAWSDKGGVFINPHSL